MTEYVRMRSRPGEAPRPRAHDDGGESELPAALLFAILVFLLVSFLSAWQLTARPRALTMIEAGVVSATDIDRLLDDDFENLQDYALTVDENTFVVPGFPVEVRVTRDEVTESTRDEFRALLLQRAGATVYEHGTSAFDTSGDQAISRLSFEGGLQFLINGITGSWHTLAQWAAVVLTFLAAALALYVLRREDGHRRFVLLGAFTAGAGLAGCLAVFVLRTLAGRYGGDDPFSADLREIADAALSVPMTNFVVVTIAGVVVTAIGFALKFAYRRFFPEHQPGKYTPPIGPVIEDEDEPFDPFDDDAFDAPDFTDAEPG